MEFSGQIPFFLQKFLSKPASALPKGAQWVMVFEGSFNASGGTDFDTLPVQAILNTIDYEPKKWAIEESLRTTLGDDYQKTKGCLFAQAVQIPGENNVANPEGIQFGGYIRGYVGGGRDPLEPLKITFLETNISFVDNVIRPWVITTSYLGMIARSGADKNYRCNISVYKLGVVTPQDFPFILQKYTFYGACPVNVSGEEYNYTQVSSPINREVTFVYHYYSLDSVTNNKINSTNNESNYPLQLSTKDKDINVTTTGAKIIKE
jgi:hypothetical protein